MARARFLARRRRSRHRTPGASGSRPARRSSRVMTRTASHNSVLSLGWCISAALTVLSMRTVAPFSSFSYWALTSKAWPGCALDAVACSRSLSETARPYLHKIAIVHAISRHLEFMAGH
jgi:hypothetical protein